MKKGSITIKRYQKHQICIEMPAFKAFRAHLSSFTTGITSSTFAPSPGKGMGETQPGRSRAVATYPRPVKSGE